MNEKEFKQRLGEIAEEYGWYRTIKTLEQVAHDVEKYVG